MRKREIREKIRATLQVFSMGFFLLALATAAPGGQEQFPMRPGQRAPSPNNPFGEQDPAIAAKQMRALNADRQKSLVADTNRLVKLAQELNSEMASDDEDGATPQQLRNAAEIEKLAHNVKQKMSFAVGGGPQFQDPIQIPIR